MRVADDEPGVECWIDFAQLGFIVGPVTGKRKKVQALIFTAMYSRHVFVWLTHTQTLEAAIAECEMAWPFFWGVLKYSFWIT